MSLARYRPPQPWKHPDDRRPPISLAPGNRMEWGNMDLVSAFQDVAHAQAEIPPAMRVGFPLLFPVSRAYGSCRCDQRRGQLCVDPGARRGVSWGRDANYYD